MTEEPRALTPEERKRNVRRVQDAEARLAQTETRLLVAATTLSAVYGEVRAARGMIREAMQLAPLDTPPPLFGPPQEDGLDRETRDAVTAELRELAYATRNPRQTALLRLAEILDGGPGEGDARESAATAGAGS